MATAMHHIGFVVPRMDAALRRFIDDGAQVLVEPIFDPIQRVTVALLMTDDVVPIELVAPPAEGDSPLTARLNRGGGLDHVCLSVPDVPAALEREVERGSLIVCEPVVAVAFNRQIAFVQRRNGLVVEFISEAEVVA